MRILLTAAVLVGLWGCGQRWLPNAPFRVAGGPAYDQVLTRARGLGYVVVENDPVRGYFRVRARLDADMVVGYSESGGVGGAIAVARVSFFHVQAHRNGTVTVKASGYHVRDGNTMIHRRLHEELARFAGALQAAR